MQGKELLIQKINFVAGVMRKTALCKEEVRPITSSPTPFLMSDLRNESTDKSMKNQNRRRFFVCGGSGHDCCNCPYKKVEGLRDGDSDSEKMIQ